MAFKSILGATCTCLAVVSINVNAVVLEERLGGLAYYDPSADLTWLADANAGAASIFDEGFSAIDGDIMWQSAENWDFTVFNQDHVFTAADIVGYNPYTPRIVTEPPPPFTGWAVRYGDVPSVPVPATVWLFGSGLISLVGLARRKAHV